MNLAADLGLAPGMSVFVHVAAVTNPERIIATIAAKIRIPIRVFFIPVTLIYHLPVFCCEYE
jgi:hypothetical protein